VSGWTNPVCGSSHWLDVGEKMMDYFKVLGQLIFIIWALFMIGGTVILFTYMMWQTLRSIYKGEW
jgi:cytochrome c oxidase subunit IV